MKLALYLPNFRNHVTIKELEDLTALAEELDFDSVWTLDRIVVPESSDRAELQFPFGMMTDFPNGMPVISRGKWFQGMTLIPWLAAKTQKVRIGMSIIDTPYRAPGVLAAELAWACARHAPRGPSSSQRWRSARTPPFAMVARSSACAFARSSPHTRGAPR